MLLSRKAKKNLSAWVFLTPSLIGMILFVTVPILISVGLSFTEWNLLGSVSWVGLDNYKEILKSEKFYTALKHTLYFISLYLPSVVILAFLIASLLNKKIKGMRVFRAIYFLPVVTSWVAVSVVWRWVFNGEYGLLNYLLQFIGIDGPSWLTDPKWAMTAVIITSIWKDLGFVAVIFLTGLQEIPDMYYESASIDGANGWQKMKSITIPLMFNTIHFVVVISLINSFQVFDQVWIMTEGGPAGASSVIVEQIYRNAFRYYKMGTASSLSWVLFLIIFISTYIMNQIKKKMEVM
jgi:multiple sugar transport system permease protein